MVTNKPSATIKDVMKFFYETVPAYQGSSVHLGKEGLERIRRALQLCSDPQEVVPTIHIAGTSGKGTVGHMIEALLHAHGFTTVLVTSPHVYTIKERVRVNAKLPSNRDFIEDATMLRALYERLTDEGTFLTFYECMTLMGFLAVQRHRPDYLILETGVGGRYDSSNCITRQDKIAVITNIGMDHVELLGPTITDITLQKLGIITTNQPTFLMAQTYEVETLAQVEAARYGSKVMVVRDQIECVRWPGAHGAANAGLAVAVVRFCAKRDGWDRRHMQPPQLCATLNAVTIPGRFEQKLIRGKRIIFDGAHNIQKISAVMESMAILNGDEPFGVVFASSKNDADTQMRVIQKYTNNILATSYNDPTVTRHKPPVPISMYSNNVRIISQEEAVRHVFASPNTTWLVTGSFYILPEMRKKLMHYGTMYKK